jgi:hypothetical protein
MKKAVILGNTALNYSWFVLTYRQGLLRNGWDVTDIDYKSQSLQNIKGQLLTLKPKYVFTHLTFHQSVHNLSNVLNMYREVTQKVGTKFVHTCNDARREDRYMGDVSDVIYMAFVGTLDLVHNGNNAWNIPTYYAPYSSLCYDKMAKPVPDLMFPVPLFTGSYGSHNDRKKFIDKLLKRMKVAIVGTQTQGDLRHRTPELSVSARCILGLCTGYDIDGYIDVRPFQYLGTGACMIMRKYKNMDAVIPEHLYYPFDSYNNEGADKVLEHWERIQKTDTRPMQESAFEYIQAHHSCKVRLAFVLEKLENGY